ncbi:hypothetical protein GGR57DRAFT_446259 [Xylariaceae sp. FL1272]|nr:hypothetical protein GGR57DRAFT_446259 [Xylariaceae sp. FL1272]
MPFFSPLVLRPSNLIYLTTAGAHALHFTIGLLFIILAHAHFQVLWAAGDYEYSTRGLFTGHRVLSVHAAPDAHGELQTWCHLPLLACVTDRIGTADAFPASPCPVGFLQRVEMHPAAVHRHRVSLSSRMRCISSSIWLVSAPSTT